MSVVVNSFNFKITKNKNINNNGIECLNIKLARKISKM